MIKMDELKVIKRTDLNPNAFVYQIRAGMIHYGSKLPMIEICEFNPYVRDVENVANYFQIGFKYHGKLLNQLKKLQQECKRSAPEKATEALALINEIESAHLAQLNIDLPDTLDNFEHDGGGFIK
jgi:hypothetical protein